MMMIVEQPAIELGLLQRGLNRFKIRHEGLILICPIALN